jgi:hypothetical protein
VTLWRSTNSRMAFSAMYDSVRSSASAISCNAATIDGATRTPMFTFFSDSGFEFRGMAGIVSMGASIVLPLILLASLTLLARVG